MPTDKNGNIKARWLLTIGLIMIISIHTQKIYFLNKIIDKFQYMQEPHITVTLNWSVHTPAHSKIHGA